MIDPPEASGRSPGAAVTAHGDDGDAARRLQALAEISRLVTLGLDERAILQHVTEAVTRLFDAPYAGMWMLEAHTGDLVVAATAGPLSSAVQPGLRRPPGTNTLNQVVLAHGQPYQTADVEAHPNWVNHAISQRWGLRTYLGVPLMVGERRFGILTLLFHEPRVFGTEDLELVETVAAQAAAALANARAYERAAALGKISQMLSSNLEPHAVFEAAVAATARLLGVQDVRLWLHDAAADMLRLAARAPAGNRTDEVSLPVDGSLSARALRSGQPFVAHDIAADPRWRVLFPPADRPASGLFVPLMQQDRPLGVIVALSASERAFGEDDLDLLRALASQVAMAIQNARLYGEARERSHRLTTILDVNKRLALGPRLEEILARITEEAARLLGAEGATLRLLEGDELARAATYGLGERLMVRERLPRRGTLVGHLIAENRPILITDPEGDPHLDPRYRAELRAQGLRSWLGVPLRGPDRVLGTLAVFSRQEHDRDAADISLLEAFAGQAALAIENARLLATTERRAAEAMAVAEVGRAITGSLDVQAVLDLIVDQACRLLGVPRSALAVLELEEGGPIYQFVARRGLSDQFVERIRPRHPRDGTTAWAIVERRPIWSADLLHDPMFELSPGTRAAVETEGYRAVLSVPLLVGDRTLGALVVYRDVVGPFTAEEVELLRVFADQAAVALDNARLFQQEQERRRQLEAVRDVTAEITRELDLTAVLELIVRRAAELVEATAGAVHLWDEANQVIVPQAWCGVGAWLGELRLRLGEGATGCAVQRRTGVIINDLRSSPHAPRIMLERTQLSAVLSQPILYQDRLIGAITVGRDETAHPFSERDLGLLGIFADHAAVAIENARLFQQATTRAARMRRLAELSRLASQNLEPRRVQEFSVAAAGDLLAADFAQLWLVEDGEDSLALVAGTGTSDESRPDQLPSPTVRLPLQGSLLGHVVTSGCRRYSPDLAEDALQIHKAWAQRHGVRSQLAVPLTAGSRAIGVLTVAYCRLRQFSADEIELLETFAAQVAIAIENARLFEQAATVEALRELARVKAEFLSTASHELRTPLTLIHGYAELLRDRAPRLSRTKLAEMAAAVYAGSSTMARLVDDLLNLSRLEHGQFELRRSRVAVADVLTRLVQDFRSQPGGARIVVELPAAREANLDPERLAQIVSNLLSNALRYAPEGPIVLRAVCESGWLRVEVSDQGPGIPAAEQRRIWEKFYRGDQALNSPNRGSGLGLPIVKQLTELQGGRVGVRSHPGRGATFWFTLPIDGVA